MALSHRVGKYLLGDSLGTGATGTVRYAVNTETGERVAIKIIDKQKLSKTEGLAEQIEREIVVMKHLHCENLVSLRGVMRSEKHIWIVMECLGGGSLLDLLMNEGRFDEPQTRLYFRQIIHALEFCHNLQIYHRDLKPDNILLTSDYLTAKIADFGLATLVTEDPLRWRNTRCGSTQYAAPELFASEDSSYSPGPVDIWGAGLLLYIMAAGFPPFKQNVTGDLVEQIVSAKIKFPPWFSPSIKDLIRNILKANPQERYTIEQIKHHPWFTEEAISSKSPGVPSFLLNSPLKRSTSSYSSKSSPRKQIDFGLDDTQENSMSNSGITVLTDSDADIEDQNSVPAVNAFDLINMTGAFDLNRLFMGPSIKPFKLSHCTKFVWNDSNVSKLFSLLVQILDNKTLSAKKYEKSGRIVVAALTKHATKFEIQLYHMLPTALLVEFNLIQGPDVAFYKIYKALYSEILPHLPKKPDSSGEIPRPNWLSMMPDKESEDFVEDNQLHVSKSN